MRPSVFKLILWVAVSMICGRAIASPPPNDHFAAATVQSGTFWLTQGTLYGATSELNEPVLTGYPNGPTAWWQWTAPVSGQFRVNTWGSEKTTILAVYRGDTLDTTRLISFAPTESTFTNAARVEFAATAGEMYSIQILGADYSSPYFISDPFLPSRIQLSLTPALGTPLPAINDTFAEALVISGDSADVVINNANAISEPGEPLDLPDARGNTVWMAWTAPSAGVWQIDTRQGDHDTTTAVYTGSAVNDLTRLDFSDNTSSIAGDQGARGGRLTFRAAAGETYHIQIQGASLPGSSLDYGSVRVLFQPVQPPANDEFADALILTGTSPSADGWSTFATREGEEPAADADESRSIWWRWTAPATGLLAVIQYGGAIDAYSGASLTDLIRLPYAPNAVQRGSRGAVTDWYSVTAGTVVHLRGTGDRPVYSLRLVQQPENDDFADAKILTGPAVSDTVDMEYASWEVNEIQTDSAGPQTVWYRWTAPSTGKYIINTQGSPYFTRVVLYTGDSLAALTEVGEESLIGFSPEAYDRIILNAMSGTEYKIQLLRESIVSDLDHLNIRPANPPSNDHFAAAIEMTGSAWSTIGSNVDATLETDEPYISVGNPSGFSVWWKWTAPASGLFRLTTTGSEIGTVLGLYTGPEFNELTLIGADGNNGWRNTGSVTFNAVLGTDYSITVDGQSRQQGALQLALSPVTAPPNDTFASRLVLSGPSVQAGGSVTGATTEAGEPVIPGATGGHSVWYEWTAPATGTAIFKVAAPGFDPAVGIFSGETPASLSANVTGGSGATASGIRTFLVGYPVSSGTSYKVLIDGSPANSGVFVVSISMEAPPVNDSFDARAALDGIVVHGSSNNQGATLQVGEPAHAGIPARASVWWEWTAPSSGPVTMDTSGGTAQARIAVYTGTALTALTPIASESVTFPKTFGTVNFTAAAGMKYIIAADSGDRSRGDVSLNIVTADAVAPNDSFAAATVWASDQAETLVRPQGATSEPGEPAHGGRPAARSLWWAWTPQTTRHASLWYETETATLLTRLNIYKGTTLDSLTPVLTQAADSHWQRRQLDVLAGETYYIVLDTPSGPVDPGWIKLGIVPVNGTQENAASVIPEDGMVSASMTGAYNEDPLLSPSARRRIWWTWTAEVNARMEWRVFAPEESDVISSVSSTSAFSRGGTGQPVPGSDEMLTTFDAFAGVTYYFNVSTRVAVPISVQLVETTRQVPPSNDLQHRAIDMAGTSWSIPLTLGAESNDRLYWTWTAPSAGVAQITLEGPLAEADALLAYADGGFAVTAGASRTNGGPPVLRIASAAGQQWTLASRTSLKRLRPATLSLISPAPGSPPDNDSFLAPELLPASWSSVSGDVTFASCEPGEGDHSNSGGTGLQPKFPPGRSVWYDWTPAVSGPVVLRLDSETDLAMHLYRGRTQAEWFDEAYLMPGSQTLSTYLLAGETYHIAVSTRPYAEQTAPFTLRMGAASPNDMLAEAIVLTGASATSSADSTGATLEVGEPGHGFNFVTPRASLWWKWTAPASGIVTMDTIGSEFDTILAVFASDPPDATTRVAENDNATGRPGVTASAVSFYADAGQTYVIRICRQELTGTNGLLVLTEVTGPAKLNLTMGPPANPYERWLAEWPGLVGDLALETADADGDGIPNLVELSFGSNPLVPDANRSSLRILPADGGWQIEASLDRNSLEALSGGSSLEIAWEVSRNLMNWQPASASQYIRREGRLSIERLLLRPGEPPFARLSIRMPP